MQQEQSRKRTAPGTWPQNPPQGLGQSPQTQSNMPNTSDMSDDQFLSWTANNTYHGHNAGPSRQQYPSNSAPGLATVQQASQALVQRMNNTQLAEPDPYMSQLQQLDNARGTPTVMDDSDEDEAELEARAQEAKREAATKRPPRQIPPFIQKLSR